MPVSQTSLVFNEHNGFEDYLSGIPGGCFLLEFICCFSHDLTGYGFLEVKSLKCHVHCIISRVHDIQVTFHCRC